MKLYYVLSVNKYYVNEAEARDVADAYSVYGHSPEVRIIDSPTLPEIQAALDDTTEREDYAYEREYCSFADMIAVVKKYGDEVDSLRSFFGQESARNSEALYYDTLENTLLGY